MKTPQLPAPYEVPSFERGKKALEAAGLTTFDVFLDEGLYDYRLTCQKCLATWRTTTRIIFAVLIESAKKHKCKV